MPQKQIEAHIVHEDGSQFLVCHITWQHGLSKERRDNFTRSIASEFGRIMQGKNK